MKELVSEYGMLAVTILLFLTTALYTFATFRLTAISLRAHELNTRPLLTFQPPSVVANGWIALSIKQEVVNIGVSYVRIESALVHWWPYMLKEQHKTTKSNLILPCYVAPGGKVEFEFDINSKIVKDLPQGSLIVLSEIITGHLAYKYRGLDSTVLETVEPLP
jgi:hypothetical protein